MAKKPGKGSFPKDSTPSIKGGLPTGGIVKPGPAMSKPTIPRRGMK